MIKLFIYAILRFLRRLFLFTFYVANVGPFFTPLVIRRFSISFYLKQIVSVTLENYEDLQMNSKNTMQDVIQASGTQDNPVQEVLRMVDYNSSFLDIQRLVHSQWDTANTEAVFDSRMYSPLLIDILSLINKIAAFVYSLNTLCFFRYFEQ